MLIKLLSISIIVVVLTLQFLQVKAVTHQSTKLLNWSIGFTVAEVGLLAFQLNFNFDKLLDQHRNTAKKALAIKNNLLVYKANGNVNKAGLQRFVDELNDIYASAPQTGNLAKWLANRQ